MVETPNACPVLTVTKSELRVILQCTAYTRWRGKVMTDEVLHDVLQIDREQFNKLREFTVPQTRALAEYFKTQFNAYFSCNS